MYVSSKCVHVQKLTGHSTDAAMTQAHQAMSVFSTDTTLIYIVSSIEMYMFGVAQTTAPSFISCNVKTLAAARLCCCDRCAAADVWSRRRRRHDLHAACSASCPPLQAPPLVAPSAGAACRAAFASCCCCDHVTTSLASS